MHIATLLAAGGLAAALPTTVQQRDNNNAIFSTLTANTFINSAPCSLGSQSVCVGRSTQALIQYFFNGYQATVDTLKRDAIPDGTWIPVANSTAVDGVEIHYYQSDNIRGIRSIDRGASTVQKRKSIDESAQGGFVGDFYWHAPNQQAYNSFHSTSSEVSNIANILATYILKYSSIESCVDFGDNDGELNSGVVTFGWNGQGFKVSQIAMHDHRLL